MKNILKEMFSNKRNIIIASAVAALLIVVIIIAIVFATDTNDNAKESATTTKKTEVTTKVLSPEEKAFLEGGGLFDEATGTISSFGTMTDVVIPETINGVTVKYIECSVRTMYKNINLKSLYIPDTVIGCAFGIDNEPKDEFEYFVCAPWVRSNG